MARHYRTRGEIPASHVVPPQPTRPGSSQWWWTWVILAQIYPLGTYTGWNIWNMYTCGTYNTGSGFILLNAPTVWYVLKVDGLTFSPGYTENGDWGLVKDVPPVNMWVLHVQRWYILQRSWILSSSMSQYTTLKIVSVTNSDCLAQY